MAGKTGGSLQTARDIMSSEVVTVAPGTQVAEAARIMLEQGVNGLPVVDEAGGLAGIICQSDLVVQQKRFPVPSFFTILDTMIPVRSPRDLEREVQKIAAVTVAEAMTREVETVAPDEAVSRVAELMVEKGYHTLPVVEGDRLVGVIGKADVLRMLLPAKDGG
jgi:CBS domain-containing protein